MDSQEIRRRIEEITVWKRGGERAPHKPLLLLYALARCSRGEPRLVLYEEADADLRGLLEEFGPPRRSHHPEYLFWRLENDGLWELEGPKAGEIRERSTDPGRSYLIEHSTLGGFPEEVHEAFSADPRLIGEIAEEILERNFPRSVHEDILAEVGLDLEVRTVAGRPRDPAFREKVLRAYGFGCGICGFNVRLRDTLVALEAADIRWHQAGGPDTEKNGVALCSLHHKLVDRGAFTIGTDRRLQVSEQVNGREGVDEWLLEFHGRPLRGPERTAHRPGDRYSPGTCGRSFAGRRERGPGRAVMPPADLHTARTAHAPDRRPASPGLASLRKPPRMDRPKRDVTT